MRVLVLLAAILCGVVCVHSAKLPRPLRDWPTDILYPKTAICEKKFPNFYSYESCLTTNRGDASARKCQHVVESCNCIPRFVKTAISRLTRPNNPHRNVYICVYLVHKVGMRVPGCCTKYFQPNPLQKSSNKIGKSKRETKMDPMLKDEYQQVISGERLKRNAATANYWDYWGYWDYWDWVELMGSEGDGGFRA